MIIEGLDLDGQYLRQCKSSGTDVLGRRRIESVPMREATIKVVPLCCNPLWRHLESCPRLQWFFGLNLEATRAGSTSMHHILIARWSNVILLLAVSHVDEDAFKCLAVALVVGRLGHFIQLGIDWE